MVSDELGSLAAFVAVAEAKSFTRAAGRLGTSQSALSHRVRRLENRLGIALLARNTRSVSVTDAGQRLLETLGPALQDIEAKLTALKGDAARITGTLRITAADHAAETLLWPAVKIIIAQHPDLCVDVSVDNRLVDVVAERFDAGIRLGNNLSEDMVAVPIGPAERPIVVASPDYVSRNGVPLAPEDLSAHNCINRRLPSLEGFPQWTFSHGKRQIRVRVKGTLAFDRPEMILQAAIDGYGLAFLLSSQVEEEFARGTLVPVMANWCASVPGYHLYYPSTRLKSPALAALVDAIRLRGSDKCPE